MNIYAEQSGVKGNLPNCRSRDLPTTAPIGDPLSNRFRRLQLWLLIDASHGQKGQTMTRYGQRGWHKVGPDRHVSTHIL